MSGDTETQIEPADSDEQTPNIAVVASVVFTTVTLLAAVAYSVMVNLIDWVAIGVLSYPVDAVAPFVVITGAILTIPIVIPTVLITARVSE